ncbi:MAG: hypothetical protein Q4D50_10280 [Eubacteriales bacterium]|nr:hypothetical protein [Eubacteriales bacterium]
MKRILCFAVLLAVIFPIISIGCMAKEENEETVVGYFDDGSYMTEMIEINGVRATGTITGTKTRTYYGSSGTTKWQAILTGKFSYNGTSATCTSASIDVTIYDSAWYVISKSASRSGNTAYGTATLGEKVLGVTVSEVPVNLTLSCDANGNLS